MPTFSDKELRMIDRVTPKDMDLSKVSHIKSAWERYLLLPDRVGGYQETKFDHILEKLK